MSVQFGRWNFSGQTAATDYIEKVSAFLAPFGPDTNDQYSKNGTTILYRAFCTTKESWSEKQPHVSRSGAVIVWDGRLDNRKELFSELRGSLSADSPDVLFVAAAYDTWGNKCFEKLIGDWALSIWNPDERSVLLAKDPIGIRHLYYSIAEDNVTWSTILDPLVLYAGRTFELCEEYIASWFSCIFPPVHLTPYVNLYAVPPSSTVTIGPKKRHIIRKYWDFDPGKQIRYRSDAEYEEHFRTVFSQAIQRRLRSDRPVLAELSGGMDSSSIVCMADDVTARGNACCPRLDTISWFDDSYDHIEPDSNELHWIAKVEEKRGRAGCHINFREVKSQEASKQEPCKPEFDNSCLAVTPHSQGGNHPFAKQYAAYMKSEGHRVTLSGIGGDEPTGNEVPTPTLELQDLLARARFITLARQLSAWASRMRKPRLLLLKEAIQELFLANPTSYVRFCAAPWFSPEFVRRNRAALEGYPSRMKLFGPFPSFQDNINKFRGARAALMYLGLQSEPLRDERYPYLDRDFLEFMFAIPRAQVVGVGKRRFLMKRALTGIVPDELLNRRRKAFVPPESGENAATEPPSFPEVGHMISGSRGIINVHQFHEALQKARSNAEVPVQSVGRTLTLEFWLRNLMSHGVLTDSMPREKQSHFPSLTAEVNSLRPPDLRV